jgi:hypothetical protein
MLLHARRCSPNGLVRKGRQRATVTVTRRSSYDNICVEVVMRVPTSGQLVFASAGACCGVAGVATETSPHDWEQRVTTFAHSGLRQCEGWMARRSDSFALNVLAAATARSGCRCSSITTHSEICSAQFFSTGREHAHLLAQQTDSTTARRKASKKTTRCTYFSN